MQLGDCPKCGTGNTESLKVADTIELRQCNKCSHQWIEKLVTFKRPDPQTVFLRLAALLAERGTCKRAKVGCVVTDESNVILATGYNGSLPGSPHCIDSECLVVDGHCIRTIHAEMNALIRLRGGNKQRLVGYCTHTPCLTCLKAGLQLGIYTWYYLKEYKDHNRQELLQWHNANHPADSCISLVYKYLAPEKA